MWAAVCALATAQFSFGAGASSVTIASSTNDVRLQAASEAARPAKPDEVVADGVAVQTGENSRVELKIGENVVRLGANTAIRPEKGGRIINLSDGLILIDATRHSRARRIEFGQVAAEIGSSTVIAESHPGDHWQSEGRDERSR
jgi:hypothetical protein